MGRRRTADLGSSALRSSDIDDEPFRPVAAQLEEILEVDQIIRLEILDQLRQQIVRRERSQSDQSICDPKLFVGKIVAGVDLASHQAGTLECTLPDENICATVSQLSGHELGSI